MLCFYLSFFYKNIHDKIYIKHHYKMQNHFNFYKFSFTLKPMNFSLNFYYNFLRNALFTISLISSDFKKLISSPNPKPSVITIYKFSKSLIIIFLLIFNKIYIIFFTKFHPKFSEIFSNHLKKV